MKIMVAHGHVESRHEKQMALRRRISEEKHASHIRRQTAMVFRTEFMIFMVLDTMAPQSTISEENHASHNRRQTAMVFLIK